MLIDASLSENDSAIDKKTQPDIIDLPTLLYESTASLDYRSSILEKF